MALTTAEVVKAFIDMYNAVNSHKLENYPEETLTVLEDVHYTINEDGRYVSIRRSNPRTEIRD